MASKREELLQAIVATLDDASKPAGLSVHRHRTRPLQQDQLPALVVYLQPEAVAPGDGKGPRAYKVQRHCKIRVEARVAVTDPDDDTSPDAALDPYLSWAVQRVMLDRTQGGRAKATNEIGTQWAAEEGDAVYGAAAVDFEVEFITAIGNPDAD